MVWHHFDEIRQSTSSVFEEKGLVLSRFSRLWPVYRASRSWHRRTIKLSGFYNIDYNSMDYFTTWKMFFLLLTDRRLWHLAVFLLVFEPLKVRLASHLLLDGVLCQLPVGLTQLVFQHCLTQYDHDTSPLLKLHVSSWIYSDWWNSARHFLPSTFCWTDTNTILQKLKLSTDANWLDLTTCTPKILVKQILKHGTGIRKLAWLIDRDKVLCPT